MALPQDRIGAEFRSARPGSSLVVVSMDSHVAPPVSQYREYCDSRHLARFDEFARAVSDAFLLRPGPGSPTHNEGFTQSDESRAYWSDVENRFNGEANYADPYRRLQTMDADGVAAELVFHGGHNRMPQPFFSLDLPGVFGQSIPTDREAAELRAAGYRAYNRWLADFISVNADRLVGVAYVPIWDIDAAVAEVEHVHRLGFRAINLPAPKVGLRTYNVPEYDRFWAACVDRGMTLHSHAATGDPNLPDRGPGFFSMRLAELEYSSRRHLWHMIFGGVFERFPQLAMTLTEQAGIWVVPTLQNLDSVYLAKQQARETPHISEWLPRLPSEYFMKNVWIGASFTSRFEVQASIDGGYAHKMMWGRDFPHPEGTWPVTRESMRFNFAGFQEQDVRSILGNAAVDFLGLDAKVLGGVADAIGPTMDEVQTPLEQVPSAGSLSHGFRRVGAYA